MKRYLWNHEFARGDWNRPDRPSVDCAYPFVEKYANTGSILDLGCGQGRAGNELDATRYRRYTGVDVSDVALETARRTSVETGLTARHVYEQSDIFSYVPTEQHDVILFMESIYYVPWRKIVPMLTRYAKYLKHDGVFIVRLWSGNDKYAPIVDIIERNFRVLEKHVSTEPRAVVIVFRES